jgi:cytidine deaminase
MGWIFKDGITGRIYDNIDERWLRAIEAAGRANPTPFQSGYHVKWGAITASGIAVYGSNHEMAKSDTIAHAEEEVILASIKDSSQGDPIEICASLAPGPDGIVNPCGNCRDALKDYSNLENLVVIGASVPKRTAVIIPGLAYFKRTFREVDRAGLQTLRKSQGVMKALTMEKRAIDLSSTSVSPLAYGAAIECENGLSFGGSFRGSIAYHSVLPISSAIEVWRNGSSDHKRRFVSCLLVHSAEGMPEVFYKDRQDALEFAEAIQMINDRPGVPLPVYLIDSFGSRAWRTDTNEWLPYPFSSRNLGIKEKLVEEYQKLFI